jgi:F-type H+-transporting ATPase subunit alpha
MALLLKKSPGRDAFPSDIFYLHSTLLERAGQFFTGSLTALPIVETLSRDVSAYVPTNIISITDGQLFLDSSYFNKGILPAVHVSLSVSRIGSKAQYPCLGKMARWFKKKIMEFRKMENLLSFCDDVDKETLMTLKFGLRLSEFLCQMKNDPYSIYDQMILFALIYKGSLRYVPITHVQIFKTFVIN